MNFFQVVTDFPFKIKTCNSSLVRIRKPTSSSGLTEALLDPSVTSFKGFPCTIYVHVRGKKTTTLKSSIIKEKNKYVHVHPGYQGSSLP